MIVAMPFADAMSVGVFFLAVIFFLPCCVLVFSRFAQRYSCKKLKKYIADEEQRLKNIEVCMASNLPPDSGCESGMVYGGAVLGLSTWQFAYNELRKLFGGELANKQKLNALATALAKVRLLQDAERQNARYIFNVKFTVCGALQDCKTSVRTINVLASATFRR